MREFVASSDFLCIADRCDRCGAQAFAGAMVRGTKLLFCGHHFRKAKDKLRLVADVLADETYKLGGMYDIS